MATTAFKAALSRCGLQAPQQKIVVEQGVSNIDDLASFEAQEFKSSIQQWKKIPAVVTASGSTRRRVTETVTHMALTIVMGRNLLALYCWAFCHDLTGVVVNANDFMGSDDPAANRAMLRKWAGRAADHDGYMKKQKDSPPEKPAKFVHFGKWRTFVEGLQIYLSQLRSQHISAIPLVYLMMERDVSVEGRAKVTSAKYDSIDDQLVACIDLNHFSVENEDKAVYHILAELTRDTDAEVSRSP